MEPINVFDYESLAKARIEPSTWNYYQDGANDGVSLRANRAAFERFSVAEGAERPAKLFPPAIRKVSDWPSITNMR